MEKNEPEGRTRSSDMAELVRNVTDSDGRSRIDSSLWLSHPCTTSSFTQAHNGQRKGVLPSISCSQETTDSKVPHL